MEDRVWVRALDRLEIGDRDDALALLNDCETAPDTLDGALASLLLAALHGGAPARPRQLARPRQTEDELARATYATLEACARAAYALSAGRIEELTREVGRAHAAVPPTWLWLRLRVASLHQAAFRFTADTDAMDAAMRMAREAADRTDCPHMAVLARGILASVSLLAGRLHETLEACEAGIALALATDLGDHRSVALCHQFRGYVLFEWNRLAEAERELKQAWTSSGPAARGVRSGVARMLAAVAAESGDRAAADRWCHELEDVVSEPLTLRNREWLAAVRIRQGAGGEGELRRIDEWRRRYAYEVEGLRSLHPSHLPSRLHELERLLTVLEATRQWEQIPELARLLREGSRRVRLWFHVRALTFEAVALLRQARAEEARPIWEKALGEGEVGGFVRAFTDGAPARFALLRQAAQEGPASRSAARVLEAAGTDDPAPLLTPKQTAVLELVAAGMRNRAVGEALGIAEATVRTHLRAVFSRLEVTSRTEAVAAARKEGLLA